MTDTICNTCPSKSFSSSRSLAHFSHTHSARFAYSKTHTHTQRVQVTLGSLVSARLAHAVICGDCGVGVVGGDGTARICSNTGSSSRVECSKFTLALTVRVRVCVAAEQRHCVCSACSRAHLIHALCVLARKSLLCARMIHPSATTSGLCVL